MKYLLLLTLLITSGLSAYQTQVEVSLSMAKDKLSLTDFTDQVSAIPLEHTKHGEFSDIYEVVVTDDFLFLSTFLKTDNEGIFKVLQFSKDGSFLKQIGETSNARFGLVYDFENEILGVSTKKKLSYYSNTGERVSTSEVDTNHFFIYSSNLYGVVMNFDNSRWSYSLNQYVGLDLTKAVNLAKITDPSEDAFFMGFKPQSTYNNDKAFISFHVDNTIYELHNNELKKYVELNIKLPLVKKPSLSQGIVGSWVFASCSYPSRASMIFLYNLKSQKSYLIPFKASQYKIEAGIRDDIYDSGYFIPSISIKNKPSAQSTQLFYYLKNPSDVPKFKNVKAKKILFIASTK